MRLLIAAVGKLKQGPERELIRHYLGRAKAAGRKLHLSPLAVIELPESKAATAKARKAAEGEALLAKIPSSHRLIALDPSGEALSSAAFAARLAKLRDGGAQGSLSSSAAPTASPPSCWPGPRRYRSEPSRCRMGSPASCSPNSSIARRRSSRATPITAAEAES